MTGEGEFSQREGHLTMDMSDLGGGAFGNGAAELAFSDLVYYMKLPQGAGLPLPPGKEWFKIDLKELGQTRGSTSSSSCSSPRATRARLSTSFQGASETSTKSARRTCAASDDALHGHDRPRHGRRAHPPI